jgi:hypothetical protein
MTTPRRSSRPVVLRRLLEPQRDHARILAQAYDRLFQSVATPHLSVTPSCYQVGTPSSNSRRVYEENQL